LSNISNIGQMKWMLRLESHKVQYLDHSYF
jgi:hypothetical protein